MPVRPPSDAATAARSLPRRFRALFAGLGEDESPDALAGRPGSDGASAISHLVAASHGLAAATRGLDAGDGADLASPALDPAPASGSVEERIAELGLEAEALADRIDRLDAAAWGLPRRVAPDGEISALDYLWRAVDAAVDHLKAAERALDEARRAR